MLMQSVLRSVVLDQQTQPHFITAGAVLQDLAYMLQICFLTRGTAYTTAGPGKCLYH